MSTAPCPSCAEMSAELERLKAKAALDYLHPEPDAAAQRIAELEASIVAAREALRIAGARVVSLEAELEGERVNAKEDRRVHGELYRHVRDIANDVGELAHSVSTAAALEPGKVHGELRSIRDRLRRRATMHAPRASVAQEALKLPASE